MNPEVHLSNDELLRLRNLTTSPDWSAFIKYLESVKVAAGKSMRRLTNSLQTYGYFSGVIQVIEDIENLPVDVLKIIQKERTNDNEE